MSCSSRCLKQFNMFLLPVWVIYNVERAVYTETQAVCACHTQLIRANTNWTSGGATVSGQKNKDTWWILIKQKGKRCVWGCWWWRLVSLLRVLAEWHNWTPFAILLKFRVFGDTFFFFFCCPLKIIERNRGHWLREGEKVIKTDVMALRGPDTAILEGMHKQDRPRNRLSERKKQTDRHQLMFFLAA